MPHSELGFLKIGAAHFSLSKTKSALQENLVTVVRGQRSAQGDFGRSGSCLVQPSSSSRRLIPGSSRGHCPTTYSSTDTASIATASASREPCRQSKQWHSLALEQAQTRSLEEGTAGPKHSSVPHQGNTAPGMLGTAGAAPLRTASINTLQRQCASLRKEISHKGEIK